MNHINKNTHLITAILAAGHGNRMHSALPKVLHEVNNKPLIGHVIKTAQALNPDRIIAILGYGRQEVLNYIKDYQIEYVIQEQQLGTGHAVQQMEQILENSGGHLLVLSGDVPLLRTATLEQLFNEHLSSNSGATILTAILDDPSGYGRIIRNPDHTFDAIVEHKDCSDEQRKISEINAGIYIFKIQPLFKALKAIDNNNVQGEYYLPDVLGYFTKSGKPITAQIIVDPLEISGVNTIEQLANVNSIYLERYAKTN